MYDLVRIVPPPGDGIRAAQGTRVFAQDGSEIGGVTRISIDFPIDGVITATMDLAINAETIAAVPMLSLESLKQAADYYGFMLVEKKAGHCCG